MTVLPGEPPQEKAHLEGMALRLERWSTRKAIFNVGGAVHCQVCVGCGAIFDLRAEPDKLAKMLPE